jgi:hypothetical protein
VSGLLGLSCSSAESIAGSLAGRSRFRSWGEACHPKPLSQLQNQALDGDQSVDMKVACGE